MGIVSLPAAQALVPFFPQGPFRSVGFGKEFDGCPYLYAHVRGTDQWVGPYTNLSVVEHGEISAPDHTAALDHLRSTYGYLYERWDTATTHSEVVFMASHKDYPKTRPIVAKSWDELIIKICQAITEGQEKQTNADIRAEA